MRGKGCKVMTSMRPLLMLAGLVLGLNGHTSQAGETIHVWILAGQSNATGLGETPELPASSGLGVPQDKIKFFYDVAGYKTYPFRNSGGWTTLRPGSGSFSGATGAPDNGYYTTQYGSELSFGDVVATLNPDQKFAIIKVAKGATGLDMDWRIDGGSLGTHLYDRLVSDVNTQTNTLRSQGYVVQFEGLIWDQGESDANVQAQADAFQTNLTHLLGKLRTDLNTPALKMVVPQLSQSQINTGQVNATGAATVQQAVRNMAAADPLVCYVTTDDLHVRQDGVHFTGLSQLIVGQRMAYAVSGVSKPAPTYSVVQTNSVSGGSQLAFPASSVDLINKGSPSLASEYHTDYAGGFYSGYSTTAAALNDGTQGSNQWTAAAAFGEIAQENGNLPNFSWWTSSYGLDLTNAPNGYNITEIHSIAGWTSNRLNQRYELWVSKVGDPGYEKVGELVLNSTASGSSQIKLTGVAGNVIASGVDAIWFNFLDPSTGLNNDDTAYREMDVFGEPTSPIQAWRSRYFGTILNSGSAADLADTDANGVPNLVEYAVGADPLASGGSTPCTTGVSDGRLTLSYTKSKTATDITTVAEVSGDLVNWSSAPADVEQQWQIIDGSTVQTVTARDLTSSPPATGRFMRIRVTRP